MSLINTARQSLNWKKLLVRFWNLKKKQKSVRVWNKSLLEFRCRIGKIQRIRLWKNFFTRQILYIVVKKTNQILNLRCFGISDSRKLCTQRSSFFFLIRENDINCDFRAFREIMVLKKNLATRQILNWKGNNASQFDLKENNASDFELNKYSASEFELKETTRQILKLRKPKASEFELKLLLHVRFGIGKKQIFGFWI